MSNRIIRIAAGVIGLTIAALPQVASAQSGYDGPSSYQPYVREDFRPVGEGTRYEDPRGYDDQGYRALRHADDRPRYDERQALGFDGSELYGRPDHWPHQDRPVGWPQDGYGYRPVAAPVGPVYGGEFPRQADDLGCTVQRSEHRTYDGGREVVTRRTCYAR